MTFEGAFLIIKIICHGKGVHRKMSDGEKKKEEKPASFYDQVPNFDSRKPSRLRKYFDRVIPALIVLSVGLVFYFFLLRFTNVSGTFSEIYDVLKPIIYGCVFAYILNPIMRTVEHWLAPLLGKYIKKENTVLRISRGIGILSAFVVVFVVITTLCNMVIPELYASIRDLIITLPGQLTEWSQKVNEFISGDSATSVMLKELLNEGIVTLQNWVRNDLLKQTNVIMSNLTAGIFGVVGELFNMIIGLIVSVYVLYSKETFASQCKKVLYAFMTPDHANLTIHITRKSNEIFGGFITGKIIDSAIIGVLCFIGTSFMNMPYALLVSVIVGVTNVIPFFGPYIGAIPSAILILLANPRKGVWFIIFIIVLQQIDGNIIGPKILGNSTGLSAFWVIFSILLGGGLFGIPGMLFGVPTFAVVYYLAELVVNGRLKKKKLPLQSEAYDFDTYVDEKGVFISREEKEVNEEKRGE